ncbi:hypothetical protein [Leifsonia poae]|uniref:hypothetical protein n=1 Tax=Leifsonia poae TaxID=110933 RepID=UPI001CBA88FB|nr:hypothetical protein [Leifsonia poae]
MASTPRIAPRARHRSPALLSLLGKSAWWLPKWLDKVLPHIDTEGHALEETPVKKPSEVTVTIGA